MNYLPMCMAYKFKWPHKSNSTNNQVYLVAYFSRCNIVIVPQFYMKQAIAGNISFQQCHIYKVFFWLKLLPHESFKIISFIFNFERSNKQCVCLVSHNMSGKKYDETHSKWREKNDTTIFHFIFILFSVFFCKKKAYHTLRHGE